MIRIEWPLLFIGIAVAFFGTLFGGGGLIGMPAMLLYGLPIHTIIAANKFSNTVSSFSSFFVLLKKCEITKEDIFALIPIALIAGGVGALLAKWMSEKWLTVFALIFLFISFALSFLPKKPKKMNKKHSIVTLSPYLFGIGMYDGMFGPGQATLLMMVYIRHPFTYLQAIALTRCQTFLSCFGAFLMYYSGGLVKWSVALPLAAGAIIGAQISVRFASKLQNPIVKKGLQIVTGCLIVQIIYSYLTGGI